MSYAIKFLAHVGLVLIAFIAAYSLRRGLGLDWWLADRDALLIIKWGVMYAAVAGCVEIIFRTERTAWRFSSASDVARLAQTTGLTALAFLAVIFLSNRAITLPRSTLLLSWMLSLFGLVGLRLLWRVSSDPRLVASFFMLPGKRSNPDARPLYLVGEVSKAEAYLRRHAAGADPDFRPVAIIADRAGLKGQFVQRLPVIGVVGDLERLVGETRHRNGPPAILFLDDPTLTLGVSTQQIGHLRADGVPMLRLPNLAELKKGGGAALQEIKLEEFLPREPISMDLGSVQAYVRGKRVLVTGAGGSIGSEICRQLASFGCAHLTMVDHSEFLLFQIEQEILAAGSQETCRAVLCNVRDADRVREVFKAAEPQVIFHAAALKHVTLVEQNPCEGVLTNVKGTLHVIEAARACKADQLVLISTDKAVDPSNVMGATKRVAEFILPRTSQDTRFCAVRFGNVLGSAGSVVPVFRSQIERGGPVTLTHEDVERYFMTIPEAVQLVLQATVISATDEALDTRKFVLEMGRPVKIRELAEKMIEICGYTVGEDIQIEVTGLKPGEKITENLLDSDEVVVVERGFVSEIASRAKAPTKSIEAAVRQLIVAAENGDAARARALLGRVVNAARGSAEERTSAEEAAA